MKSHLLVLLSWLHAATAQTTIFTVPPVQTNSSSVPPLTTLPPATATISPSAPPLSQSFPVNVTISGITLQLINVPPLIDLETRFSLWENTTRDFFNQFYFNNDVGIRNFTTDISFLSQDSVLRNGVIVTTFNYSQSLAYTSLDGSQTPGYYAVYPFTTEEGNAQYVAALNLSFTGWENMMVPLPVPLLPGQTGAPSFAPSGAPAASLIPSVGPSALTVNSSAPSLFPSLAPSQIPSLGLSEAPSELAASNEPSSVPSMAETSLAPSSEETTAEPVEMIDVLLMNIQLPLKGGGVLEDDEIDMWERVTDEWFADFFSGSDRRRLQASGIESIISKFTFVRQEEDNSIVYNQNLKYEASEETADSEAVALLPFNDDEANVKYGEILQREFANMKGLILPLTIPKILGRNATPLDEGIGDDDSGLSMGALIGIIAAGAAVLLVCAYVAYGVVRGSGDGDIGVEQRDHESEVSPQFHMSRSEEELSMMDDPYMPHKQKSFDDKILDVGYGDRR